MGTRMAPVYANLFLFQRLQSIVVVLITGSLYLPTEHRIISPVFHSYYMTNTLVPRSDNIKDLGVLFDKDLDFSIHVDHREVYTFRLLFALCTAPLYDPLQNTLVQCGPWSRIHYRLPALQRRFIRLIGVRNFIFFLSPSDVKLVIFCFFGRSLMGRCSAQIFGPKLILEPPPPTLDLVNFLLVAITPPTSTIIFLWQDLPDWVIKLSVFRDSIHCVRHRALAVHSSCNNS
ncbi:hypothetical protein J6590_029025 [Homalodisca vitripennis]|nr:hypothetical protein J6590_029025 [Homalodisca vitripennis]